MALCVSRPDVARAPSSTRGRPAIRRRRRATLVVAGIRTRHPHARLRRPGLARLRSSRIMSRSPATSLSLTRWFRSLKGRFFETGERDAFFHAVDLRQAVEAYSSIARWRSTTASRQARMDCRSWDTGDWNDGMDRVGEGGKGESVWLGWFLFSVLNAFAIWPTSMADSDHAKRWRKHSRALKELRSSNRLGTATGIVALISTMERRSARSPTANAASIRSPNPGPSSRAPRNRRALRAPWLRSTNI